jgi:hypothetical protein
MADDIAEELDRRIWRDLKPSDSAIGVVEWGISQPPVYDDD